MPTATSSNTQPTLAEALSDLPPRVRVHELARRAGLNSKDAITALAAAGVDVASASSSIDREVAEGLLTELLGQPAKAGSAKAASTKAASTKAASTKAGSAKATSPQGGGAVRSVSKRGSARSVPNEAEPAQSQPAETEPIEPARVAAVEAEPKGQGSRRGRRRGGSTAEQRPALAADDHTPDPGADRLTDEPDSTVTTDGDHAEDDHAGSGRGRRRRRGGRGRRGGRAGEPDSQDESQDEEAESAADAQEAGADSELSDPATDSKDSAGRRRSPRKRGRSPETGEVADDVTTRDGESVESDGVDGGDDSDDDGESGSRRRRRRRRRRGSGDGEGEADEPQTRHSAAPATVQGLKGSTRLEAKRQRRRDSRETRRRPQILSESEFLARRESVDRVMAVRQRGDLAQVALLEDGVLVEHFVSQQGAASMIGNVYVGRVQNVLPSMEAAFVDIGKGRNAVLYAGEVNWDIAGLEGKERRIETALSSGDTVLVQVSKDPIGHKGARLTTQISLPGRFLVFVPDGGATGISRKLPDTERKRLKKILDTIVPAEAGVIIRTAAEGVGEEDLAADVERLRAQWEEISAAARKATDSGSAPKQLYAEPDTLIKVVRDLFNSDIHRLLIDGDQAWESLSEYVLAVAPELAERVSRYIGEKDVFDAYRIDEQIAKALQRKVRLPSGGSLVIDRTEAMTVVDVNTGKFTGSGGNLEETVTRNNLEAAEEIVRQLRLRDIGGIIVVDFIDMVLESNRDLVLRRLTECLGRDRTRHQVAEVTSLGLVQMTRKRMGLGLVETFSEPCDACNGRGIVLHDAPSAIEEFDDSDRAESARAGRKGRKRGRGQDEHDDPSKFQPLVVDRISTDVKPDPRGPKPPALFRAEEGGDALVDGDGDVAVGAGVVEAVDTDMATVDDNGAAPNTPGKAPADGSRGRGRRAKAAVVTSSTEVAAVDIAAETIEPDVVASPAVADNADTVVAAEKKPARRRRAAGRPAGAPASSATAVDLVIPAAGGGSN